MAVKLPAQNKGRFEQAHAALVQETRPEWNRKLTKRCLEFLWYTALSREEQLRYDGKHETPFTWMIPHAIPPAYSKTKKNEEERKNFLRGLRDDPSTCTAPEKDGEAHAESASGDNVQEHGSEQQGLDPKGSGEEGPTGGGSEEGPRASDPAQTNRIKYLEAQVAELRKNSAFPRSNAPERRPWPNLAHIPDLSPTDGGDNDPTGYFHELFPIQMQRHLRPYAARHSRLDEHRRNTDEQYLQEAVKYERMTRGGNIEGQDGDEVLNHDGGNWKFHRMLGKGGFGTVALWRKITESGDIVDTVAVKEEESRAPSEWTNPLHWRDGLPMEISIYEHLKKINPPCPYLMSSRGHRLNLRQRRWRLYLPYKPGLTLGQPLEFRVGWKEDYEIPLDFIFYAFLAMAEACLALDYGWWGGEENEPPAEEVKKTGGRKAGWIPIVHRDIKPGNVFLDSEPYDNDARWNMYPTPCVGDMGLAFEAYPDDPYNPENYIPAGTPSYCAPEQRGHRPFGVPFARELSDRTNVFAIATSIFELWQASLPGFIAHYSEKEADRSEDNSHLPPNHIERYCRDRLAEHYEFQYGKRCSPRPDQRVKDNVTELRNNMIGDGSHWVYLWELEKWKSEWLLRSIHKSVNRRDGHKWVSGLEKRPLQGTKEVKLASILRQCLEWDTDDRPSILKLRNMVKDAIEELGINPSRDEEPIISDYHGVRDQSGNLLPLLWCKGGLLFPMDDKKGSLDFAKWFGDAMDSGYFKDKKYGLLEMVRRAMIQQLRPTQSKNEQGNKGHPNNEPSVAEGASKNGGGASSRRKRTRSDGGSEEASKRQKSLSDAVAEEAHVAENPDS